MRLVPTPRQEIEPAALTPSGPVMVAAYWMSSPALSPMPTVGFMLRMLTPAPSASGLPSSPVTVTASALAEAGATAAAVSTVIVAASSRTRRVFVMPESSRPTSRPLPLLRLLLGRPDQDLVDRDVPRSRVTT